MHATDALSADATFDVIFRLANATEKRFTVGIEGTKRLAITGCDGLGEMSLG